ncbi:GMC family oxidoreductase [Pseudorhizobium endolithicum]|uniref:GMC family oxidoreductase n=1 Tax=Pseudorhizobium endolithicum TaxID=1191678 RepID=A0ABN7JHW2_9HYPH|nr:GMC oxidoreductase [Pseudorhizobium endolithicum]CAD7032218.1 GMC family oxidoreductase [Pseudorhizobium endolithicum]
MLIEGTESLFDKTWNVCVIGAGPVGITAALELASNGQHVLLLESGVMEPDPSIQELSDATLVNRCSHADLSIAVQRSFGGTSNLWGAACIPLDPIDFESRPTVTGATWPISYDDFACYLPDACEYAQCGMPQFQASIDGMPKGSSEFRSDGLVRYSQKPNFGRAYEEAIRSSAMIDVRLGVTVTEPHFSESGIVEALTVVDRSGNRGLVRAQVFLVACGGVETARLLLSGQISAPLRFGGDDGPLGRGYMGHLSGQLAEIEMFNASFDKGMDFFRPEGGAYARRRLVASRDIQLEESLTNIAFWPVTPEFGDPAHRDAILSLAYLVLTYPPLGRLVVSEAIRQFNVGNREIARLPHVVNLIRGFPSAVCFLPPFLYRRLVAQPRLPGLHLRNPGRRYALHYNAEHLPNPNSRIQLDSRRDPTGCHRAAINLQFSRSDAEPVVRAHSMLADWLSKNRLGNLIWRCPKEQQVDYVLEHARDGVHQIGTARMAATPQDGVVDENCCAFGSRNLYVAGSAVFPTSGHANPTLSAIALAVRTSRHIASRLSKLPRVASAKAKCMLVGIGVTEATFKFEHLLGC